MNIALVLPISDPHAGGGYAFQEQVFEGFLELAKKSSHQFFIFSSKARTTAVQNVQVIPFERPLGDRVIAFLNKFQDQFFGKRVLPLQSRFQKVLNQNQCQMIWFFTPEFWPCDQPYIFTVWDLEQLTQPWFSEVSAGGEWERRFWFYVLPLMKSTLVIVPSNTSKALVEKSLGLSAHRILVAHHPTPKLSPNTQSQIISKARLQKPFLFYPAQFWPHKNHSVLLKALSQLKAMGQRFDLALSGSDKGNLSRVIEEAERLGVKDQLKILGFVSDDELIALYRGAHALVYPSFFGPENLPPLEAASLGCPAIIADVEGAREQMENAALYFHPVQADQLVECILQLNVSATREALVQAGRALAASRPVAGYVEPVLKFLNEFSARY